MEITSVFSGVTLWGVGLAIIFGALWLAALQPRPLSKLFPWLLLAAGAVLFAPALFYVYTPLENLFGEWLIYPYGQDTFLQQILWRNIPFIMLGALVQEGARIAPVAVYWQYKGRNLDPRLGLSLGAMAGAGFGIMEVQWMNNQIFNNGWTLDMLRTEGLLSLAFFWRTLFTLGFNISLNAVWGWGMAKGWGWQFFVFTLLAQAVLNYAVLLTQVLALPALISIMILTVFTLAAFSLALKLHRRKTSAEIQPDFQVADSEPGR